MLTRLFRSWLARLDYSDAGDGRGDTFFRRYDVLKTRWGSVYLHEFFRSDKDRCKHDHPWPFVTVILRGGYWEEVFVYPPEEGGPIIAGVREPNLSSTVKVWRRPGYIGRYPAIHAHRIELEPGTRPWSLVIAGRKSRPWGFWRRDGWVAWTKGQPNPICETRP